MRAGWALADRDDAVWRLRRSPPSTEPISRTGAVVADRSDLTSEGMAIPGKRRVLTGYAAEAPRRRNLESSHSEGTDFVGGVSGEAVSHRVAVACTVLTL